MGSSARLRLYMEDNGPLILDGGLASELEAQGAKLQVKTCRKVTFRFANIHVESQCVMLLSSRN